MSGASSAVMRTRGLWRKIAKLLWVMSSNTVVRRGALLSAAAPRLVQSAGAPPTAEASTTPAPAPAAPALPPPQPQNVRPHAGAMAQAFAPASQRFAVDDLVQADFHARKTYYDGVVVAARADGDRVPVPHRVRRRRRRGRRPGGAH